MNASVILGLSVLAGVAVFFLYQWVATSASLREMTLVEQVNAEIADQRARAAKTKLRDRARNKLRELGLGNNLSAPIAIMLMLLLLVVTGLSLLGINGAVSILVALPLSVAVVVRTSASVTTKRARAINRQLVQALQLIAGQLEAGNGVMSAIDSSLPSLADPLQSELTKALEGSGVNADATEAFKALAHKYPSRSLNLVIAAFEVNRDEGSKISQAIRQAADTLLLDRELNEETDAEISQVRSEFWVIVSMIAGIAAVMFASQAHPASGQDPYTSPVAIIGLFLGCANFLFGIYRGLRIFNKAKGTI